MLTPEVTSIAEHNFSGGNVFFFFFQTEHIKYKNT